MLLLTLSQNRTYASESIGELFNRVYGDVFLYTSKYALENKLHDMESELRNVSIVNAVNEASITQMAYRDKIISNRLDEISEISETLDVLNSKYKYSITNMDLDEALTDKLNLQNFLMTNDISLDFSTSILNNVFDPILIKLPEGDLVSLDAKVKKLRLEIKFAPEYDLGNVPSAYPVEGRITSGFGVRKDPINYQTSWHTGLDIGAPTGTNIYAWFSGTIKNAEYHSGWGNQITTVQDTVMIRYAHLNEILVKPGDRVKQGDLIGKVGSTGRSTGPHLHLGVYINNIAVDPQRIINRR